MRIGRASESKTYLTGASALGSDSGDRAFLQHRVARFGLLGGSLYLLFLGYGAVGVVLAGRYYALLDPVFGYMLMASLSLLAVWAVCRAGERSMTVIRAVEATGLLTSCAAFGLLANDLPLWSAPEKTVLLSQTLALTARAVYIPSTARRTLTLALLASIPIIASTFITYYLHFSPSDWMDPDLQALTAIQVAGIVTVYALGWWSLTAILCTTASRIIFGLRRQVSDVRKLGQYHLERKIGEGGMGTVYEASHAMLRRPTAIKLLRPGKATAKAMGRFEREVQLTAQLSHPNTITIYDYGRTPDGIFFYAMEYLEGANLHDVVQVGGPMDPRRVAHILFQVGGALAEAHGIGLIHRDIKPANIMLCKQGGAHDVAKVLDFGLVKLDERQVPVSELLESNTEMVIGTPYYLSPESVLAPDIVDARSDIYALGAVGYYLLTGTQLFTGATAVEVCMHHVNTTPEPPGSRLGKPIPEALEKLVMQCLEKSPNARPDSGEEIQTALRQYCAAEPWTAQEALKWWEVYGGTLADLRNTMLNNQADSRVLTVDVQRRRLTDPPDPAASTGVADDSDDE